MPIVNCQLPIMSALHIYNPSDITSITENITELYYAIFIDHSKIVIPKGVKTLRIYTNGIVDLPEGLKILQYYCTQPVNRFPNSLKKLTINYLPEDIIFPENLEYLEITGTTINTINFPNNLEELTLCRCKINCDLVLPDHLHKIDITGTTHKNIKSNNSLKKIIYQENDNFNKLEITDNLKELIIFDKNVRCLPNLFNLNYLKIYDSSIEYLPYLPKLKYYSNHHFTKFLTFFGYDMYQHHFANKFYEAVKLNKCIKTLQNKYRKQ